MPQDNVDRLRSGYEVLSRTGEWPSDGLLAPAFELHQDAFVDNARVSHGPDAPGELIRRLQQSFRDMSFEAEQFIEAPDGNVVVLVHTQGRGQASGIAIDKQQAHVWSFTSDTAIRMRVYGQIAEALKAVGLAD